MNTQPVGFIGVGQMGLPMARNLLSAGFELVVFDVNPKALAAVQAAGARTVDSPVQVAAEADVVLVSLPAPPIVEQVALGDNGIVRGDRVKAYVDLSTTGSVVAQRVAQGLATKGIEALDCPVSGGERGAVAGTLSLMVAGPETLFQSLRPVLSPIGTKHFYIGDQVGLGQTLKLCNYFLSAANSIASAEAMVTAAKAGLDPDVTLDVINASSGKNSATAEKFKELVLSRQFNKSMTTRLLHKDLSLFTAEAEALGVPAWVGSHIKQLLAYSISQGYGDKASVTMIQHWEKWAGVEVKSKAS